METIQSSYTLTGVEFTYTGSLKSGLMVYTRYDSSFHIPLNIIEIIKAEIEAKSPVYMGANRDKPYPG
jgi:hypothetical protein